MNAQRLSFEEFYCRCRDGCLRAVLVRVGDQDTAQELVAEAFTRACASWRKVSRHPAPEAWVVRTALNLGISWWRRRRREVPVPDPGIVADLAVSDAGASSRGDPRVMAALRRLPPRQQQVVTMRLLLDLDTRRTAELLGITPNTVMAHMTRALAALREDLMSAQQQGSAS